MPQRVELKHELEVVAALMDRLALDIQKEQTEHAQKEGALLAERDQLISEREKIGTQIAAGRADAGTFGRLQVIEVRLAEIARACDLLGKVTFSGSAELELLRTKREILSHLEVLGYQFVVEMEDLSIWPSAVQLRFKASEADRPVGVCEVVFDNRAVTIEISNSSQYNPKARPTGLEWIPGYRSEQEVPVVHGTADAEAWRIGTDVIAVRRLAAPPRAGHPLREVVFKKLQDLGLTSIGELAERELNKVGRMVDMQQEYAPNSLLGRIKETVLAVTVPRCRFARTNNTRDTQHPSAAFHGDWEAFVHAPWSKHLTNSVAKLKYTLESKERPRFWHEETDGHFGFRLRTRDHSWLTGEVFVDPFLPPATDSTPIQVRGGDQLLHGRLHLKVQEERDGQSHGRFGL